ncbi:vomeronasal 1 receptor ornAnaV1R3142 [Ornithorhynchus anatinus]|uniref:vomeronasal 1 receptor ornAnaV1R3142 n=1 Tax=Ornithorhynchus anatinus TaxID=9258 RepID=UPI00015557F8|nr:vomeronasal 1 receptor ornAnaV1R3142 [Ornithorhynchus anatinus]
MSLSELVFSIFFLAQTGIGLLGNSTLLLLYISIFLAQPSQIKTTDLIVTHLTMANTVILLTNTVPGMMMASEGENPMNVVGCQIVLYIRRVSRGLSICTMSLLSMSQAITISPSTSCWARLKPRAPKFILRSFPFFWILCFLLDMNTLNTVEVIRNVTTAFIGVTRKSCPSSVGTTGFYYFAFVSAFTLRDILFVCVMSWSSGYMVMVLHRHRKHMQHIHSSSLSPKSSIESKATQTILLLVICFMFFYLINCGIVFLSYVVKDALKLYVPGLFLGSCFAFLCPLVFISKDPRFPRLLCDLKKAERSLFGHRYRGRTIKIQR